MSLVEELVTHFQKLDSSQQQHLLNVARAFVNISTVKGEPGSQFVQAVGYWDKDDLNEMQAAIEEGCEEINWSEWE